jgi:hypothetical protein
LLVECTVFWDCYNCCSLHFSVLLFGKTCLINNLDWMETCFCWKMFPFPRTLSGKQCKVTCNKWRLFNVEIGVKKNNLIENWFNIYCSCVYNFMPFFSLKFIWEWSFLTQRRKGLSCVVHKIAYMCGVLWGNTEHCKMRKGRGPGNEWWSVNSGVSYVVWMFDVAWVINT